MEKEKQKNLESFLSLTNKSFKGGFQDNFERMNVRGIWQGNTASLCSSHHCLGTQYFSRLMGLSGLRDIQNDTHSPVLQQNIMKKKYSGSETIPNTEQRIEGEVGDL